MGQRNSTVGRWNYTTPLPPVHTRKLMWGINEILRLRAWFHQLRCRSKYFLLEFSVLLIRIAIIAFKVCSIFIYVGFRETKVDSPYFRRFERAGLCTVSISPPINARRNS